jgi:hexosaminidase
LGSVKELHEFGIHFLENTRSWIFGPRLVEFSVSDNGTTFSNIFIKSFETPQKDQEQLISVPFYYDCKARFVKVRAVNARKLPDWHPGKGEPAWLFVDEIIAR